MRIDPVDKSVPTRHWCPTSRPCNSPTKFRGNTHAVRKPGVLALAKFSAIMSNRSVERLNTARMPSAMSFMEVCWLECQILVFHQRPWPHNPNSMLSMLLIAFSVDFRLPI